MEVREVEEFGHRLQDVWIDTFKLKVIKSRFHRNDEKRKVDNEDKQFCLLTREEGEGSIQKGRSFKTALINLRVTYTI
jgi:hypothetical protein